MSGPSALVVGAGSIGRRHLRNLASLGAGPLGVVDTDAARASEAAAETGAAAHASLEQGLAGRPGVVLVCTPAVTHVAAARQALDAGATVFVEKPIAARSSAELAELLAAARGTKRLIVGYNLRFHAGLARVKALVEQGTAGRLLTVRAEFGQYLADWRPGTDYRTNYIAAREGGGILLDASHEIDYVRWLCGPVDGVVAVTGHVSDLEMASEDVALLLLRHEGGVLSEVHLDCVQRGYARGCKVVGSAGTIEWTFKGGVRHTANGAAWTEERIVPDVNQMYLDEMRHVLACARGAATPLVDGEAGAAVLAVVEAAHQAARERREVRP